MYEELVKRLRELHPEAFGNQWDFAYACQQLMHEATDAIEGLMDISNSILSKYKIVAGALIWECSGKIDEDTDELFKEIDNYRSQISGEPEPPKEENE